ncbi:MOS1T transposase, partial [Pseudoatta argentina]
MSKFLPNKVYLRGILLHYFIQKKSAAEAHRILVQTYGDQLMRLSRAFKEKRPLYAQRHDKVILLHDNARPHVAKPVKTYLETLKWEVLPHPPYSPDIAPSDFPLFRSMDFIIQGQQMGCWSVAISDFPHLVPVWQPRGCPAAPYVEPPCFIRPLTIRPHSFLGDRLLCIACICPARSVTGSRVWNSTARSDRSTNVQKTPARVLGLGYEESNFRRTGKLDDRGFKASVDTPA